MEKLAFINRKDMTSILMGCQEKRMREESTKTYKNSGNYQATISEWLWRAKHFSMCFVWIISCSSNTPRQVLPWCLHRWGIWSPERWGGWPGLSVVISRSQDLNPVVWCCSPCSWPPYLRVRPGEWVDSVAGSWPKFSADCFCFLSEECNNIHISSEWGELIRDI